MKITKIVVENLFSYDKFEIELHKDINIIVGPNNAGKTNLFRVIQLFRDIINYKVRAKELTDYLHDPLKENAKIKIWVEFEESEKQLIKEFFECYFSEYLEELDEGIKSGDFKIKNVLPEYNGPEGHYDKSYLNFKVNLIFKRSLLEFIRALPEFLSSGVFIWTYRGEYDKIPEISFHTGYYISSDEINAELLSRMGLNEDNSRHQKILEKYSLPDAENISIDIISDGMDIFILTKRGTGKNVRLEVALEKEYSDLMKKIGVPASLKFLFDGAFYISPKFMLLFLTSFSSFVLPKLEMGKISENKKAVAEKLFEYSGLRFESMIHLTLHNLLLKIFDNSIVKFEEVRGYPEPQKLTSLLDYRGNGKDLANYLFHLKNASDPKIRKRYDIIRREFGRILDPEHPESETFDVVLIEEELTPKVVILSNGKQYEIQRVASGLFELLNLLSVIIGHQKKVVLLDEPVLHLHPTYQKKLAHILSDIATENQLIVITHSPYLIDSDKLEHVYRFYKRHTATLAVTIGNLINDADRRRFARNGQLIRSLFANGVILAEGLSEYLSLPLLFSKLGYPPEDYNIEIINCESKTGILPLIRLFEQLDIPYRVVCDEDTIKTDLQQFYVDNPHLVFYSKGYHDWTDYLRDVFGLDLGDKAEGAWKIAKTVNPNDVKTKMQDLKDFIEQFVNSL